MIYVNRTDVYNISVDIPKPVLFAEFSFKTQTRTKCCRFYLEVVTVFFFSLALNRNGRFSFSVRHYYGRNFFFPFGTRIVCLFFFLILGLNSYATRVTETCSNDDRSGIRVTVDRCQQVCLRKKILTEFSCFTNWNVFDRIYWGT